MKSRPPWSGEEGLQSLLTQPLYASEEQKRLGDRQTVLGRLLLLWFSC